MFENIYRFSETEILAFALVLIRISVFIATWPVFGNNYVPAKLKILLSMALAFICFPIVRKITVFNEVFSDQIIFMAGKEVFIGLCMGFITRFFFFAVSAAGQICSVTLGLSAAQLFNPMVGSQGTALEQFQTVLASLIFLSISGHHLFLTALLQSFEIVPISAQGVSLGGMAGIAAMGQEVLMIAIQLSAPVIIAIFITNIAMGIIGRAVPQINVLVTSIPVTISVGFFVLVVTLPLYIMEMNGLLNIMTTRLFQVIRAF